MSWKDYFKKDSPSHPDPDKTGHKPLAKHIYRCSTCGRIHRSPLKKKSKSCMYCPGTMYLAEDK